MRDVRIAYKFGIVPPNSGRLTPMYMYYCPDILKVDWEMY